MKLVAWLLIGVSLFAAPAKAQTYTYILAQDSSGPPGLPSANLPSTDGSSIYFNTTHNSYNGENLASITFYPLSQLVQQLPEALVLTSGTGVCRQTTKSGDSYWELTVGPIDTTTGTGQPVTVTAQYTLTMFYSRGSGRGGGGAGCRFMFKAGGMSTITFN
jgi:hypothetical protein